MTIRTNQNPTVRISKTDKRIKTVWDTDTGERWDSTVICAETLGTDVINVRRACAGITKTCMGRHLSYEEDVVGTRSKMATSLASKDAENASLRSEVEALRAEVERLRKVERVRNENHDKIARLEKSIACHKRAYDSHMKAASAAMKYLAARQKELDELLHKSEEE